MRLALALNLAATALAAPLYVTRLHTAPAVTVTDTYTTITNTHTAPTVEIFVSNEVTYTFTLTDAQEYPEPTTFTTTFVKKDQVTAADTTTSKTVITLAPTTTQAAAATSTSTTPPAATPVADAPTTTSTSTPAAAAPTTTTSTTTPAAAAPTTTTSTTTPAAAAPTTTTSTTTPAAAAPTTTTSTTAPAADAPTTTTSTTTPAAAAPTTTTSTTAPAAAAPTTVTTSTDKATTTTGESTYKAAQTNTALYATAENAVTTATAAATTETATTGYDVDSGSYSTENSFGKAIPTAIVYSPYENDGTCKGYDTVRSDLITIKAAGINKVRIYGTDCNSINTIEPNAKALGLKINQGFWISSEGYSSITSAVDDLISWGETNGWEVFDFITIGNEAVIANYLTVSELITIIADVKRRLQAAGYPGLVTTSEPPVIFENNPELCTNSAIDFVGINAHSYFDGYSTAASAGTFVLGQYNIVKKICGDKEVLVTETGYPSAGITNGGNVPSVANQKIAVEAILKELESKVTILSTYNDYWKQPGDYGIEQSFGTIQLYQN